MLELIINQEKINKLAKEFGARFVVLHGSYAIEKTHAESDIDVAIMFNNSKKISQLSFSEYGKLLEQVRDALDSPINKIDISCLNNANILLRYEITSKGVLLFGNPDAYEQYCAFAYRDYIDAQSLFELEDILIQKRQDYLSSYATR